MELILCKVGESFCSPTHNIVPHFLAWPSMSNFFEEHCPHRNNILFLSSQFEVIHIHRFELSFFHGVRISLLNWTRFSQLAFPFTVLPQNDHRDFVLEERLGLPYWTMILAICVVVDESKCLDIPILELWTICEHLPFLLGFSLILRLLLVHRNLAIWRWYPWFWRLSFEMLMILAL